MGLRLTKHKSEEQADRAPIIMVHGREILARLTAGSDFGGEMVKGSGTGHVDVYVEQNEAGKFFAKCRMVLPNGDIRDYAGTHLFDTPEQAGEAAKAIITDVLQAQEIPYTVVRSH